MPSVPSSPRTPTKRRKPSIDLQITSANPQDNVNGFGRPLVHHRSSQYSIESPRIQRPATLQELPSVDGDSNLAEGGESNGLGNLADELAEAFDEDEESAHGETLEPKPVQFEDKTDQGLNGDDHGATKPLFPSLGSAAALDAPTSPAKQCGRTNHRRVQAEYDGSDYGNDSDYEGTDGILPNLEARMVAVDGLAQRGSHVNGDNMENLIQHFADSLKELPSQSRVENGVARYAPHD